MAELNLIMDGYDDDPESDAENDESTREVKMRRVHQRKDYKTSGWWQDLQDGDLSDPAGLPGAFAVTFAYHAVSSRSWWRW